MSILKFCPHVHAYRGQKMEGEVRWVRKKLEYVVPSVVC